MNPDRDRKLYISRKSDDLFSGALQFDSPEADYTIELIKHCNEKILNSGINVFRLEDYPITVIPERIIIVNGSEDGLPLSGETYNVFKSIIREKSYPIELFIADTRTDIYDNINSKTLVVSQSVTQKVYNMEDAKNLSEKGAVITPSYITAPGGLLSDKLLTYKLLYESDKSLVADFKIVRRDKRNLTDIVSEILHESWRFYRKTKHPIVYVKPVSGGGGRGGFRIFMYNDGFVLPDMSKLTGRASDMDIMYLPFITLNSFQMKEMAWLFRVFEKDELLKKNYLKVTIDDLKSMYGTDDDVATITKHLEDSNRNFERYASEKKISFSEAEKVLFEAMSSYEEKYGHYVPIICKHVDFGNWGLRVHLRLTSMGFIVESMYPRIFQLVLDKRGVGLVGSDNLSNRHTGKIEVQRAFPFNRIMVDAIGGELRFMGGVANAVHSAISVASLIPEALRKYVPLRMEFDIAPLSRIVIEGNADTSRGMAFLTPWNLFVKNTEEWFESLLKYYSYVKDKELTKLQIYDYEIGGEL